MSLKRKIAITILSLCFIFATLLGVVGYKANTTLPVYAANELTETEYYAQLTHYGSSGTNNENNIANSKTRARISFSIKMATGTNITFKGDTTVYKWAVNEMSAPYAIWDSVLLDTGWKTDNSTYAITQDCYPTIVIMRNDSAVLTDDELYAVKDWFTVSGTKVLPTTTSTSGSLTTDEYNSQVASFGSLPWQNTLRRARLTIAIRLRKGAVVTFKGNTSTYNWGVIETNNPSQFVEGAYLDSGWLGTATSYTTKLDGVYLVLTIKGATDDSAAVNLSSTDLTSIHSLFSITATKLGGDTIADVEQKDYAINSIAHRGVPYYAPENTLPAYEKAAKLGFKMVECDISFTSDGEPVLLHDDTIDRTSNGSGNVSGMTKEQLKTYDFGSWMGHEYAETKIPTLAEFLDCCITNSLHPYIELKGTITDEQAQKLIDVVTNKGMLKKVTWISYGTENLAKIATLDKTARVGRVASNSGDFTITETWLETQYTTIKNASSQASVFFDVWYSQGYTNGVSLKYCKSMGIPLEVWTIDNVANFDSIDPYVTGVSSNWIVAGKYLSENKTYTITWQDENGNTLETETANYGEVITGPTPTKDGYIHRGWTTTETVTTNTLGSITITNRYSKKVTVKSDMVLKPEFYTATSVWDGTYPTVKSEVDAPIYQFGGTGSASDPFLISSAQDLAALSKLSFGIDYGDYIGLDGETHDYYYNVIADINMSRGGWIPICYQNETGWIDVSSGDWDTFRGIFKGADADNNDVVHTITFGETNAKFRFGLFFGIESATVKNINLTGNVIAGNYTAGVAVASKGWTTLENITSNVNYTINYATDPIAYSGGMLGHVIQNATEGTTLKNCKYTGTIVLDKEFIGGKVGGLVGSGYNGLTLTNCPNTDDSIGNIYYDEIQVGDEINVSDYGVYPTWVGTLVGDYNDFKVTVTWGVDSAKPTTTEFGYGAKPVYTGTTPTKTSNKEGEKYVFAGWSTTDGQTNLSYAELYGAVTDNVTLYPVFSTMVKVNVIVTDTNSNVVDYGSVSVDITNSSYRIDDTSVWVYLNSEVENNGEIATITSRGTNNQVYQEYTVTITPNVIEKVGYTTTFTGFNHAGNVNQGPSIIKGSRTIRVNFNRTANTYTIKFNATSGSGEMADMSFTYDQAQNLTANTFTKSGWVFVGWATTQDGAVEYTDNQEVLNLTETNGDVITLYAQWNCGITILVNNDTWGYVDVIYPNVEENSTIIIDGNTLKVGDVIITTAIPYDVAEFRGWSTQSSGKKMTDLGVVTGGTTYYALFYAKTSVWDGTYPSVDQETQDDSTFFEGEGTNGSPYLIYDANDLATMSKLSFGKDYGRNGNGVKLYYKLMANIDLRNKNAQGVNQGGWIPISYFERGKDWVEPSSDTWTCFRGVFNGNEKTITFGEVTPKNCYGLFGGLNGATVQKLTLNGSIYSYNYSGGVASVSKGWSTLNSVTTDIDFTIGAVGSDSQARCGGMIGYAIQTATAGTTLINCKNTGDFILEKDYSHIGGLVGFSYCGELQNNQHESYGVILDADCSNSGKFYYNNNELQYVQIDYGIAPYFRGELIGCYFTKKVIVTWVVEGVTTTFEEGYGVIPVYNRANLKDDVDEDPVKQGNAQYSYPFAGWALSEDGAVVQRSPITQAITYYAIFNQTTNTYTVIINAGNGLVSLDGATGTSQIEISVEYNTVPVYDNNTKSLTIGGYVITPQTNETVANSIRYVFQNWGDGYLNAIVEDKTITPNFIKQYRVTIQNNNVDYGTVKRGDGTVVVSTGYWFNENSTITTVDATTIQINSTQFTAIVNEATAQYTYIFDGWFKNEDSLPNTITESMTIIAKFSSTTNKYTIVWTNYDGDVLETDENVPYGTIPSYDGVTPTKPNEGNTRYTFVRWNPTIASVTGNATYVAVFSTKSAVSASLSVKETVGINFYIDVLAITSNDMGSYVKLTYNHNHTSYTENIYTDTIKISDLTKEKDGTYKFSIKYASGQIADGIVLEVYNSQGVQLYTTSDDYAQGFSILAYCNKILNDENQNDEELEDLCKAIINYGKYSKENFNYKPNVEITSNVALPDASVLNNVPEAQISINTPDLQVSRFSFVALSDTSIRIYLTFPYGYDIYDYNITLTKPNVTTEMGFKTGLNSYGYYVEVYGIESANMDDLFTVTIYLKTEVDKKTTITYSALTYLKEKYNDNNASQATKNMCLAAYEYNRAAQAYFGN